MFRNDTVYCPDCGGILQSCGDDRFVICRRCGGKASAQMLMYKTVQRPKEQRALIPVLCGLSMLLLPFPLGLLLILLIGRLSPSSVLGLFIGVMLSMMVCSVLTLLLSAFVYDRINK